MLTSPTSTLSEVIVIGGVDTHADTHHAAVIDIHGRRLADQAEKTLAGMATAIPKDTTGNSEAIRVLTLTRDSAVTSRAGSAREAVVSASTAPAVRAARVQAARLPAVRVQAVPVRTAGATPEPGAVHGAGWWCWGMRWDAR
jgi:hypothetical protein